mmetsp:Transcript_3148/g.4576  ORF Transcript_3148/g.4576 Transcript_3148/m.4576 type:complete len:91 (+) Transcript_3148:558-830(+)
MLSSRGCNNGGAPLPPQQLLPLSSCDGGSDNNQQPRPQPQSFERHYTTMQEYYSPHFRITVPLAQYPGFRPPRTLSEEGGEGEEEGERGE